MLFELDQLRIKTATFESRGPADDRRDRTMLDVLRARHVVSPDLRILHMAGPTDPMLWVPDVVCGVVTHKRTGEAEYVETFRGRLQIITITAD